MDALDPLFPHMLRTARALLGWDQSEMATYAGVSKAFISRFERGDRVGQARKLIQLRDALTDAGVVLEVGENRLGVRLEGPRAESVKAERSRR